MLPWTICVDCGARIKEPRSLGLFFLLSENSDFIARHYFCGNFAVTR